MPVRLISSERLAQPLDQPRRQPERQFIDHQKLRSRHDPASDRTHLLFAARERDGILPLALAQDRKQREYIVEVAPHLGIVTPQIGAEQEVVAHVQAAEQAAVLPEHGRCRERGSGRRQAT